MTNVLIINGHQPYPFSEGRLNKSFVDKAITNLTAKGYKTRVTEVAKGYDIEEEITAHQWADIVIMQFPVNWMGTPWSLKKYMDEVYTNGMDGRLCAGDGRSEDAPKDNYGMGGSLTNSKFMMSVTFNAPAESFNDKSQPFFAGASVDDLLYPMHQNAKFFGMTSLPSFAAFDVMKNPNIDADFKRFEAHLDAHFSTADADKSAA